MANCPCCSDTLLRHLSAGKLYFLCQNCKIKIPSDEAITSSEETHPFESNVTNYQTSYNASPKDQTLNVASL